MSPIFRAFGSSRSVDEILDYKGFVVIATARQLNQPPNEVWRPLCAQWLIDNFPPAPSQPK
jgi:hypothetical protein